MSSRWSPRSVGKSDSAGLNATPGGQTISLWQGREGGVQTVKNNGCIFQVGSGPSVMKRGALFLLCDSDSERERIILGLGLSGVGYAETEWGRERERKNSREAGIITHCFVHPGIRIQNAAWWRRDWALMLFLMKTKRKKAPYLLLSDRLLFYSVTINCTTEQRLVFTYTCVCI